MFREMQDSYYEEDVDMNGGYKFQVKKMIVNLWHEHGIVYFTVAKLSAAAGFLNKSPKLWNKKTKQNR